jgi:hypothetical protein
MKEFNSQICTTREQSERLLALGLKKETADMVWNRDWCWVEDRETILALCEEHLDEYIPAWSLHRLIEMMPKCVRAHSSEDNSPSLHSYVPKFDYLGVTIENIDEILAEFYQHTDLFDNIISCIEWLIKEGYFNKEYLEGKK